VLERGGQLIIAERPAHPSTPAMPRTDSPPRRRPAPQAGPSAAGATAGRPGTAYRGTPGCPPQSGDLELLLAEVGNELEGAAKGGDVAVQHILGGDVSSFDLGNPGN
jgi:hypothetical protein